MNLKLQYLKVILVFLVLLACFCFNVYAQSSTTIGNDIVVVTIKDERGNTVSLYLPESMNNDQCGRRIYGTRTGVIGMFKTLYSEERRTESYEVAIRELCMQPEASQSYIGHLEKSLQSAGIASEDANLVLNLVKYGANSINKKYIKGGTLTADVHNRIAKVGRDLNAAQKSPAFAQVCIAFENVKATAKLTDIITGAFLLNSLSTDQAWMRLQEIERAVDSERKAQGKVDPALEEAIKQSEINLLAAQNKIGAFAVSVNDNLQEITDSAIGLGATLADMSLKFSAPVAMWVGAPLMTYNTLRGVSDQWEMAQDAVTLATLTKMIEENSQGHENITDNLTSYGQYAIYLKLEETFDVGMAKFHDFINIVGSANRDWSQYYRQRKENTTIIEMKNDNFQEESSDYSEEQIAITSIINNFVDALNNQNWAQAKKYCRPGSQADLNVDESKDSLAKYFTSDTILITKCVINNIDIYNINAKAYCSSRMIVTRNGEIIQEDNADGIIFLEKVDKWKLTKIQNN